MPPLLTVSDSTGIPDPQGPARLATPSLTGRNASGGLGRPLVEACKRAGSQGVERPVGAPLERVSKNKGVRDGMCRWQSPGVSWVSNYLGS